jgi:nicotinamidase-related amidase
VTKRTRGAFTNPDLEDHLKALGVTQVVLAGIATSSGVESTARQAYELGFNVTLAIDAMTDGSAESHEYSLKRIFPKLGETGSTQEVVEWLDNTFPTAPARLTKDRTVALPQHPISTICT